MPEWLIYAIASIACWGFVNVLDSYLIERKIWENCWDGMVISSLFKIFGVLIVGGLFFGRAIEISYTDAFLSIMGGALISASYIFCFAAMLYYNDVPLVQLVWNLSSPLVVVLGYFFLGEAFSSITYFGMAIVFLGALAISFSKDSLNCRLSRFALLLIPMVVFYSVSEVLMKFVEETRNVELGQSFPFLCLGQVLFGSAILVSRRNPAHIGRLIRQNWRFFLSGEALELLGLFIMQLAIVKTPSISLFGVVEAFMPVMVIGLTGLSIIVLKVFQKEKILKKVYDENMLSALPVKIVATLIMMAGVYFI